MSFLRNSTKIQLNRSVSCICFPLNHDSNHMIKDISSRPAIRTFSKSSCLGKKEDFYADLEITKTATALDIKNAYYKLSKKYHPDKNKGSDEAATRFRQISEAYEVLGNHGKRKRYDKGLISIHIWLFFCCNLSFYFGIGFGSFAHRPQNAQTGSEMVVQDPEDEADAQTKFYTQHMKRNLPPHMADRPTTREFDNTLDKTISQSFKERQKWMKSKDATEDKKEHFETHRSFFTGFTIAIPIFIVASIFVYIEEQKYVKTLRENKEKKS